MNLKCAFGGSLLLQPVSPCVSQEQWQSETSSCGAYRGGGTLAHRLISREDSKGWIIVFIQRHAGRDTDTDTDGDTGRQWPQSLTAAEKMKITVEFEECLKDSPRFRWVSPGFLSSFCLLIYDERINVHLKLLQAEVQRALGSYFPSLVCSKAEGQLEKQTQKHSVPLSVSHWGEFRFISPVSNWSWTIIWNTSF